MKNRTLLGACTLLFAIHSSQAANGVEEPRSVSTRWEKKWTTAAPTIDMNSRWRLFGGAAMGWGSIQDPGYTNRPDGSQILLSAITSYQAPTWVVDIGLGWFYSRFSGTQNDGRQVSVRTRAGVLDVSPRFRLTRSLQLGPVAYFTYGSDTSFTADFSHRWKGEIFAGAKLAYEFAVGKGFPVRLFTQATTDLTIPNRQTYLAWTGIQIGIPVGIVHREYSDRISISEAKTSAPERIRISLGADPVFFGSNSASVRPDHKKRLAEIGKFLDAHARDWEAIQISGHADQRGPAAYNQKLSEKRARSVFEALQIQSETEARTALKGFGFRQLKDPRNVADAWAKNRRVELVIDCVNNAELFKSELTQLAGVN